MADVYLVDDHVLMRDSLAAVLEDAGHRVVGASSDPTEALADLQALRPAVLLLDLNLGARSGFELLEPLRERVPGVRTIVLTMSAQPRNVAEARRLGALGYVLKGSPASELIAALDEVLNGRTHVTPALGGPSVESPPPGAGIGALSPRERQVVLGVVRGLSSAEIGEQLHLSPKTVDSYRSRLMTKLGAANVPALVRMAVREGWIELDAP